MTEQVRVRITPEYPELVISSDGRIQGPSGKWRKLVDDGRGYYQITRCVKGKFTTPRVHVLVCVAFHGPRPSEMHEVRHLNGNSKDNRVENLCWGTGAENQADRIRHGTDHRGEKNYKTRLTESDVREIRALRVYGFSRVSIGSWYGITPSSVGKIAARINWGWLA